MRALCACLPILCMTVAGCASPREAMRPAAQASTCVSAGRLRAWKAPDARTIYLRVGAHRYYRLGLESACPMLLAPGTHLITKVRGSEEVCGPLDWNIAASAGPEGGGTERCIVSSVTPLGAKQVAAIPERFRP